MAKEKLMFRSPFNLGDWNDDELNTEPSMTDPMQDEPIGRLVQRLLRGESVRGAAVSYDGAAVSFDQAPVTQEDGFDLADAARIAAETAPAVKAAKAAKRPKVAAGNEQKRPQEPVSTPPPATS